MMLIKRQVFQTNHLAIIFYPDQLNCLFSKLFLCDKTSNELRKWVQQNFVHYFKLMQRQGQIIEDINYRVIQSHEPMQLNVPYFDIKRKFDQIHTQEQKKHQSIFQKSTGDELLKVQKQNDQDIFQFGAEQGQVQEENLIYQQRLSEQYLTKISSIPKIVSVSQQILLSVDKFQKFTNQQSQETTKKAMDLLQKIINSQKDKEEIEKEVAKLKGKFAADIKKIERLSEIEVQRQIQKNNQLKKQLQQIKYGLQKLAEENEKISKILICHRRLINSKKATSLSKESKELLEESISILNNKLQAKPKLQSVFDEQRPEIYDPQYNWVLPDQPNKNEKIPKIIKNLEVYNFKCKKIGVQIKKGIRQQTISLQ